MFSLSIFSCFIRTNSSQLVTLRYLPFVLCTSTWLTKHCPNLRNKSSARETSERARREGLNFGHVWIGFSGLVIKAMNPEFIYNSSPKARSTRLYSIDRCTVIASLNDHAIFVSVRSIGAANENTFEEGLMKNRFLKRALSPTICIKSTRRWMAMMTMIAERGYP